MTTFRLGEKRIAKTQEDLQANWETEMSTYQFDHEWKKERERLANMEAVFDPMTIDCLNKIGVGEGWKCLGVGVTGISCRDRNSLRRLGPHAEHERTGVLVVFETLAGRASHSRPLAADIFPPNHLFLVS